MVRSCRPEFGLLSCVVLKNDGRWGINMLIFNNNSKILR